MLKAEFLSRGEYLAAGLFEEKDRSLFYRKALGLRRFYENCDIPKYNGKSLYPSGGVTQKMNIVPNYMWGFFVSKTFNEEASHLTKVLNDEFFCYHSTIPKEHAVAGNMYTHSIPNYERILKEGLLSYVPRIGKISDKDMREGLLHLIKGLECYIERCVEYLSSVNADPKLIDALKKVPLYPAQTSYEAIVAWNFVMYLDNCDNLGCLAKGLLPYYKDENLIPWLENLYDNLDMNEGYSMSLDCECPSLTIQCLKAARGKRRPMIELFVDENTPEEVWTTALETVKSGGGQPAFYNAKALFKGLKKRFPTIKDEDLKSFCGGGCTESMITGLSNVGSLDAGINLLLILENIIKSKLPYVKNFEEFYDYYLIEVEKIVENVKKQINNSRKARSKYNPIPMRTLLIDDCIDTGKEYNSGGARYGWSIINFAGLINVIDSLLAIKTLVFEKNKYNAEELIERLQNNDQEFLTEVIGIENSFGKDLDEINEFSYKISQKIFSMTETGELVFGEGFLSASIQFRSQVDAGKNIGATPDGRTAGAPLCDSLAAIYGKDSYGPTALLNSVTSLNLESALGVPVVNFNITKNFNDNVLKGLILGYFQQGGIQLQITYASKEDLLDALAHPERHGNLIVRVGGYSEYFNRLSEDLKRMVINRTIQ